MGPLVSILIPAKNAECTVLATVQSALAQTFQNIEIVCVDDGSSDRTREVLSGIQDSRIRVLSQSAQGAACARNLALRECRGDVIQFLDADDILAPDKIRLQLAMIADSPPRTIIASAWKNFSADLNERDFRVQPIWGDFDPVDWLICSWQGGGMMPIHAWLSPREVIDAAGPWNERLTVNDDGEFFCRVILASTKVRMCREATAYYRRGNPDSLSKRNDKDSVCLELQALKLCSEHLLRHEDSARTRTASAALYQRFLYAIYPKFTDLSAEVERIVAGYGGSPLQPQGGAVFRLIAQWLGWKAARHLQHVWRRAIYNTR